MPIERSAVWFADFGGADRAVLVVSSNAINRGLRSPVVCQITRTDRERNLPTYVYVEAGDGGLPDDSYVLCHEIATIDEADFRRQVGTLSVGAMVKVEAALRQCFDLPASCVLRSAPKY